MVETRVHSAVAHAGRPCNNATINVAIQPAEAVLPVLLYHGVAAGTVSDRFRRYLVPPGLFDEHLSALASAGYGLRTPLLLTRRAVAATRID